MSRHIYDEQLYSSPGLKGLILVCGNSAYNKFLNMHVAKQCVFSNLDLLQLSVITVFAKLLLIISVLSDDLDDHKRARIMLIVTRMK